MSDGVTLRGEIHYPTDDAGNMADGPFPVIVSVDPYNDNSSEERSIHALELVDSGYIRAQFDVRGSGSSGGSFRMWGPREQQDYSELIHWISDLPRSNGNVGMIGASYLAHNQFLAARAAGPDSPLKAIFPIVGGGDSWRSSFPGGLFRGLFDILWGTELTSGAQTRAPLLDALDLSTEEIVEAMKGRVAGDYQNLSYIIGSQIGTEMAYREDFWRKRSPELAVPAVVEYDIPSFLYSGWNDLLQPDIMTVYTQLQNLWAGRDQFAPMEPTQPVTGRYQAAVGPYSHMTWSEDVIVRLSRSWFDRFLKGKRNGIDKTDTPLHLFQVYGNRWVDVPTWPLPETTVETYYLDGGETGTAQHSQHDGWLRTTKPAGTDASDTINWRPTSNPCSSGMDAKHGGLLGDPGFLLGVYGPADPGVSPESPCFSDNRGVETTALVYTSAPFEQARNLAGPMSATIFARANTTNTSWVAYLSTVAPDGTSKPLSWGALLGSFRELDEDRSWYHQSDIDQSRLPADSPSAINGERGRQLQGDATGELIRPAHTFTREEEKTVKPGQIERYDVLMAPMFARIPSEHRLRLAIQTTAPWANPLSKDVNDLAGGTYQVQRNQVYASHVNVPFAEQKVEKTSTNWGPCSGYLCGNTYDS